MVVFFLR